MKKFIKTIELQKQQKSEDKLAIFKKQSKIFESK
jgi:hypothetical protein